MEYVRRVPAAPLDRFVDDVYCLAGPPRHRRLSVPPMPSAHLMINLADVPPALLTDAWFIQGERVLHLRFKVRRSA